MRERMKSGLFIVAAMVCALCLGASAAPRNDHEKDREAVKQAALDYVEGIYEVNPSRIERSVHPKLAKIGFYRKSTDVPFGAGGNMTYERLIEIAKNYNKEGKLSKNAPKEVIIYEVLDQTASAKVVAEWGIDYLHLAKFDGQWKIINILWQSPPAK